MNVVNFLKSNSLEHLKSQYSIKVKEYVEEGLIVLNYGNSSQEKHPIVKECRGLILSSKYEVVSRGFDRFFNFNEKSAEKPDLFAECFAMEKIDGSLIKLFKFKDKWCISTRGTAFGECHIYASDTTYRQAVLEALGIDEDGFQEMCKNYHFNENYTYVFELTGKNNRIVTEYNPNKYELWFLSARTNDFSGDYVDAIELPENIRRPQAFEFENMLECIRQSETLPNLQEGFVVFNRKTLAPMYKIKSPKYVRIHNVFSSDKGEPYKRQICKMIVANESSEFIAYFPEYADDVYECHRQIRQHFEIVQNEFENLKKTMKSEFDFDVFRRKAWRTFAISILKAEKKENISTNHSIDHPINHSIMYDYFMGLNDEQKQMKYIMNEIINKTLDE